MDNEWKPIKDFPELNPQVEAAPAPVEAAVAEKEWFYTDLTGAQLGPTKTSDMLALLAAGTLTQVRNLPVPC